LTKVLAKAGESTKDLDASLKRLGNTPLGVEATKSANNLNDALKRVTDQQQKLGQQATFAASGIEKLGGPTKLTTDQLNAMNQTVQKGLDAFRALGQEAPESLQKMAAAIQAQQNALDGSNKSTSIFSNLQTGLISKLAVVAGPAAFGLLIKSTLDYADSLTKLSDRTGINVVALQRLEAIAKPSGNTLEEVAQAVNKFQKNLAEGDKGATDAIRSLGLSFTDLKALKPDDQFIAIAKAIQGIKDPAEQTLIAVQLFGRGGAEILPTLKAKVDELADSTGHMSEESVKALDAFGDSLGQLKDRTVHLVGGILAELIKIPQALSNPNAPKLDSAQAFGSTVGALGGFGASGFAAAATAAKDLQAADLSLLQGFTQLPSAVNTSAEAIARASAILEAQKAIADRLGLSLEEYQKKLAEVDAKIRLLTSTSAGLNQAQQIQATSLAALGVSEDDIALKLGTSAKAVKDYFDAVKSGAAAEVEFMRQLDAQAKLQRDAEIATIALSLAIREHLLPNTVALKDQLAGVGTQLVFFSGENEAAAVHLQALDKNLLDLGQKLFASNFEIKKGHDGYAQWSKDLTELSSAFQALATVSDGAFGEIVKDIGTLIASLNVVTKGLETFKHGLADIKANGVNASNLAQTGTGLISGVSGVAQATSGGPEHRVNNIIGGVVTGAELGSFAGPIGTVVGGIIGGVVGFLRSQGPTEDQKQARSDQSKFFSETLGVKQGSPDDWGQVIAKLGPAFKDFNFNGDQALQIVSGLFDTENPEHFNAAMKVTNQLLAQEANIVPSISKGFADLNTLTAKGVQDQGQFNLESRSAIALFDQYVKKTGDLAGGLAQLKPTFDALRKGETDFGLAGNEAINKLLHLSDVAAANQPLIDQISQTTALLKDLQGAAALTREDFVAFGQDAYNQFVNLTAATGDQKTALLLMQPELQALWEQGQIFGDVTDANTKALLDQAVAQGIVGAQQEDVNHKMLDVLESINEVLGGKIPESLKKLPGAAASAASGVETELQKIKVPDLTVNVGINYDPSQLPPGLETFTGGSYGSTGGYVTARGIQHFAGGGRVLPFWSRGSDTVPAMLTPGEMVLTAAQQQSLASNMGGNLSVTVELHSVIAPSPAQMRMAGDAFVPALKDAIFRDVAGVRKIIKKAAA
jgi:hypothetical protein